MWELIRIFVPSMLLVFFSENQSQYKLGYYNEKIYIRRDKIFYFIMTLNMAVYVGLRTWYNDTVTYLQHYNSISANKSIFDGIEWSLGSNPGFMVVNNLFKVLGFSSQTFLMIFALITIVIYLWFIRKYTDDLWLSVFFFFTMGCYTFTMAAIKQTVAVAFCLIAVDRAIQKKWIPFILWILVASTFHPYSLMYCIVPLLFFKPWTKKTGILLGVFAVVGATMQVLLSKILSITTVMGEEYNIETFTGQGVNIFRLMVVWAPVILSFLARSLIRESDDRSDNLIMNLSMLNAEIMFVALFGTANYFARLANYFLIFQTITLPWLFRFFTTESKRLLTIVTVVCYLLYFLYANIINQPFDIQFNQISVWEYINSIFS